MKLILVDQRHGQTRTIVLKGWLKGLLSLCLLGTPVAFGYFGYQLAVSTENPAFTAETARDWEQELESQAAQLSDLKQQSDQHQDALTMRLALMQAQLLRLEAIGERVTEIAEIDGAEFDFTQAVGLGGPVSGNQTDYSRDEFLLAIENFEQQLDDRQQQLQILESLLTNRKIEAEAFVGGRPVELSWISSGFGRRLDPFTGKLAFHSGIDLTTGRAGAEIQAVGSGVVTWAGPRSDYGLMVELNHGNGYKTRYAHAEKIMVEVGEIVMKGQDIATVGTTGRSTGPHVHFEVYKNGRVVDPASYIRRTDR